MYELFTDRSRKVMQLANMATQECGSTTIGTEHILQGLIKEGSGVANHVFKQLNVDCGKMTKEIDKLTKQKTAATILGKLPLAPRTNKALEFAKEYSRELGRSYVGTEHILLGLLREQEGAAFQILSKNGVTEIGVKQKIVEAYTPKQMPLSLPNMTKKRSSSKAKSAKTLRMIAGLVVKHFAEDSDPTKTLEDIRKIL